MSLCYKISSELNMILYIGKGYLKPSDFYSLERAAFQENPRQKGLITLVDVLEASTSFELDDIHYFVNNINNLAESGLESGPYVMLTNDWGIHLLGQAVSLLPSKVDLKIRMYYSLSEAIGRLGFSEQKQKIIQLWNECKTEGTTISKRQLTSVS